MDSAKVVKDTGTKDWDSIKRLKTALTHKEPDRIPLDIGGERVTGLHTKAYQNYRRAYGLSPTESQIYVRFLQVARVEEDFHKIVDVDLEGVNPLPDKEESSIESAVINGSNGLRYTDRYGLKYFMPEGGHYYDVYKSPLEDAETEEDLNKFPWPDESSQAVLGNIEKEVQEVWYGHQKGIILGRTCPGLFEMLSLMRGYENAYIDLGTNPVFAEALLDKLLECKLIYYKNAIKKLLDAGVDYFITSESDDIGAQRGLIISPDMYRKFFKPRHAQLFKAIKEFSKGHAFVEFHSCGAVRELIPDFIEAGIDILNPVQVSAAGMEDSKALKKDFGDCVVFHGGGIDTQTVLSHGTPQTIKDEVKRRIEDFAPGGGFIFSPVHSVQADVPFENFTAMLEAFEQYSKY